MKRPWVIVLSGSDGRHPVTPSRRVGSEACPWPYQAIIGTRSVLQHTLDRGRQVTDPDRIVTVIGPGQRRHLDATTAPGSAGYVLELPVDRGSTAGAYMGVAHILLRDPGATVAILPADQFVFPEDRFTRCVRAACAKAEGNPGRLVVLGADARYADARMGWLMPGSPLESPADEDRPASASVAWYRRAPSRAAAELLLRNHALWSTQVIAVRASTLWRLGERFASALMEGFAAAALVLARSLTGRASAEETEAMLRQALAGLPSTELAETVLQVATSDTMVLRLDDVLWADWSQRARIEESLAYFERLPLRPGTCHGGQEVPELRVGTVPECAGTTIPERR